MLIVPRRLLLIDASPYIFRAFHSLPMTLVSPRGEPVNAVYGFFGFLLKLLAEVRPSHAAVAFDGSLTTSFRNDVYPQYKAQRELPPAELLAQQAWCREAAASIGLATLIDERYEADDLIATLLQAVEREEHAEMREIEEILIVTGDKDLAQLVAGRVVLYDFARGERLGADEVRARMGVAPSQIVDLLALAGDPVDNIPGVRGVGRKTAIALLAHFGSLDALYRRLSELPGLGLRGADGLRRRLEEQRELAFLSRQLAEVSVAAPLALEWKDLRYDGPRAEELAALCERLGFLQLAERVRRELGPPAVVTA